VGCPRSGRPLAARATSFGQQQSAPSRSVDWSPNRRQIIFTQRDARANHSGLRRQAGVSSLDASGKPSVAKEQPLGCDGQKMAPHPAVRCHY